jgi:aspartate kinase
LKIAVQKYGGTSLATRDLRNRVCKIISDTLKEGYKVVVVVSAIGRENDPYATDTFINLVKQVNPNPAARELDLIMSCGEMISGIILSNHLSAAGIKSIFLTGEQSGLITDGIYGNAHILYVNPTRVLKYLEEDMVVVVAGFQGVSENGELTTLGRGGSDTTASALGVALNAEYIDIFTDVDGIMTADPRIVEDARLIRTITYNEICQMAREGAKVVHPRAIEIAMQKGIPLRVRSTISDSPGTLVKNHIEEISGRVNITRDMLITGIAHTSNLAQIKIEIGKTSDQHGIQLKVFKSLADAGISVDFINVGQELIMFTVAQQYAETAERILKNIDIYPTIELNCAKVAVVGAAMTGIPGVMARVLEALDKHNVPVLQSGDSYTNIWCLVRKEHMKIAVQALHDYFELGKK